MHVGGRADYQCWYLWRVTSNLRTTHVQDNPCPKEDRVKSDNNPNGSDPLLDLYWGCAYNEVWRR